MNGGVRSVMVKRMPLLRVGEGQARSVSGGYLHLDLGIFTRSNEIWGSANLPMSTMA